MKQDYFLYKYWHNGIEHSIQILAYSKDDADAKLIAMQRAVFVEVRDPQAPATLPKPAGIFKSLDNLVGFGKKKLPD